MSQIKQIKAYLDGGGSLTPMNALQMFGSFRLAVTINTLRGRGMNIITVMEKNNSKRYARYFKAVK